MTKFRWNFGSPFLLTTFFWQSMFGKITTHILRFNISTRIDNQTITRLKCCIYKKLYQFYFPVHIANFSFGQAFYKITFLSLGLFRAGFLARLIYCWYLIYVTYHIFIRQFYFKSLIFKNSRFCFGTVSGIFFSTRKIWNALFFLRRCKRLNSDVHKFNNSYSQEG